MKQDKLGILEQQLKQLDQGEECPLFLGMSRCDCNNERKVVLENIDSCLTDYGKCGIVVMESQKIN